MYFSIWVSLPLLATLTRVYLPRYVVGFKMVLETAMLRNV